MNIEVMSEKQMLQEITQDVRALRKRVDGNIDRQAMHLGDMAKDIAKIREEMADHKGRIETRVGFMAAGISVFFGSAAAWIVKHLGT